MLTLPAIFLPLAYHVRRVAYRCVTSSKVSCSNNKDTIWLHYSIFFNLSWFRTWVGMRSVLSQAHMLSECSDAFPPLVLFTSRRGGKERKKKKTCFFLELEESYLYSSLPPSFHCRKEEEEKPVMFVFQTRWNLVLYSVSELHSQQQYCHQSISQKSDN